ncbi:hypothetical protein BKA65DRAFT_489252 [Rhexocercosporidium sp. MPI-PUGE-AT-0058]|nr:hypothetical protein BKA65DRAFT_489252 [Rhexocercosporidium sp. MPI-PUGE-AT-0058]
MPFLLFSKIFLLSLLVDRTAEATTFKPNCTLPPPNTNFVASPSTRGTLSILWNCLSIIILCTWNIQHLNIPARRPYYNSTGRKNGWLINAWWGFLDTRTTLWWMVLTILAPEYIMGRAVSERLAAASSLATLKSRFGDEMEMVHAYVMNMGGYYLDFSEVGFFGVDVLEISKSNPSGMSSTAVDYSGVHFTPKLDKGFSQSVGNASRTLKPIHEGEVKGQHSSIVMEKTTLPDPVSKSNIESNANLKSNKVSNTDLRSVPRGKSIPASPATYSDKPKSMAPISTFQAINLERFKHEAWALTALQLLRAKDFHLFKLLPSVSSQDLESMTNTDFLAKLIAVTQVIWLMIQLLVRHQNGILSSQMEIATLAFAVCSMVTYIIHWDRPRGITTRYEIKATKAPNEDQILALATFGPGYLWTWHRSQGDKDESLNLIPIPNDASHAVYVGNLFAGSDNVVTRTLMAWFSLNHPAVVSVIAGSVMGGTLFGSIHCLAWNFNFPTHLELILWRVSSVLSTILPPLSVYFNLQWSHYNAWAENEETLMARRIHGIVLLVFFGLPYILARLFLVFEIFWTLFFLPQEAFIDTWPGGFLLWG